MMDLRKRAGREHLYIRGVVDNDDYKVIFLQSDQQAQLSGRLRYVMADTTFDVVAPGAGKDGVSQAAIEASASKAFDWHHFSIVYVALPCRLCFDCSDSLVVEVVHSQRGGGGHTLAEHGGARGDFCGVTRGTYC